MPQPTILPVLQVLRSELDRAEAGLGAPIVATFPAGPDVDAAADALDRLIGRVRSPLTSTADELEDAVLRRLEVEREHWLDLGLLVGATVARSGLDAGRLRALIAEVSGSPDDVEQVAVPA